MFGIPFLMPDRDEHNHDDYGKYEVSMEEKGSFDHLNALPDKIMYKKGYNCNVPDIIVDETADTYHNAPSVQSSVPSLAVSHLSVFNNRRSLGLSINSIPGHPQPVRETCLVTVDKTLARRSRLLQLRSELSASAFSIVKKYIEMPKLVAASECGSIACIPAHIASNPNLAPPSFQPTDHGTEPVWQKKEDRLVVVGKETVVWAGKRPHDMYSPQVASKQYAGSTAPGTIRTCQLSQMHTLHMWPFYITKTIFHEFPKKPCLLAKQSFSIKCVPVFQTSNSTIFWTLGHVHVLTHTFHLGLCEFVHETKQSTIIAKFKKQNTVLFHWTGTLVQILPQTCCTNVAAWGISENGQFHRFDTLLPCISCSAHVLKQHACFAGKKTKLDTKSSALLYPHLHRAVYKVHVISLQSQNILTSIKMSMIFIPNSFCSYLTIHWCLSLCIN